MRLKVALLVLCVVAFSGCGREKITFEDPENLGEVITITCDITRTHCGATLVRCSNGKRYECVTQYIIRE